MFLNYNENDIAFIAYGPGATSTNQYTWGKWNIPQSANFVTFICIGGGGGGGGGYTGSAGTNGGTGGSGVVIISYPTTFSLPRAFSVAPETSGGNYIFTFTASGSITF